VPSELFLSAKEDADVLIVDCSSLDTSPAVFVLASHVDGVILVVEDGRHSAIEIKRAVKLIKAANGSVLGVILNKRRRLLPRWLYSLFSRTQ
jgi:Mrp family chromosome partitioning ATPase